MRIDPEYNYYYVYTAVCHNGKQVSCGACPQVWDNQMLTWADGNYHLYESFLLGDEEPSTVEESIFSALNDAGETSGRIQLLNLGCVVRWCLLEKEQMSVVMDIPDHIPDAKKMVKTSLIPPSYRFLDIRKTICAPPTHPGSKCFSG